MSKVRPGDWFCPKQECGFQNYSSRMQCLRCRTHRPHSSGSHHGHPYSHSSGYHYQSHARGSHGHSNSYNPGFHSSRPPPPAAQRLLPGDWICSSCNRHNFATRKVCFQCSSPASAQYLPPNYRPGDWNCPECRFHNYSARLTCHKCNAHKPNNSYGQGSSSQNNQSNGSQQNYDSHSSRDPHDRNRSSPIDQNDWVCEAPDCGQINTTKRTSCARCGTLSHSAAVAAAAAYADRAAKNTRSASNYDNYDYDDNSNRMVDDQDYDNSAHISASSKSSSRYDRRNYDDDDGIVSVSGLPAAANTDAVAAAAADDESHQAYPQPMYEFNPDDDTDH